MNVWIQNLSTYLVEQHRSLPFNKEMKTIIILLSLFLSPSLSMATSSDLNEVRACMQEINDQLGAGSLDPDLPNCCYDLALPWANANSIEGRFLYAQVLVPYLNFGIDWDSLNAKTKKFSNYYQTHLKSLIDPKAMVSWSELEVLTAFEGITDLQYSISRTFESDDGFDSYLKVFGELDRRGLATVPRAKFLYLISLLYGKWDLARSLLLRWPEISSIQIPQIVDSKPLMPSELGFYSVSSDLQTMKLKKFDWNHGPKIILAGNCHFAVDAIQAIARHKELSSIMKENGIVINWNDFGEIDFEKMNSLKKEFPDLEMHPISSSGVWFSKGINTFVSPNMTFFLDGEWKFSISGQEEFISQICFGLKKIGISAPETCGN